MKVSHKITNVLSVIQRIYSDRARVIRTAESGMVWDPKGELSTALFCGTNKPIQLYNASGATQYVAFGAQGMSAPSSASDGFPIPAGSLFVINSGDNDWVRSSSNQVFGYWDNNGEY